jgi:hypothetical protein
MDRRSPQVLLLTCIYGGSRGPAPGRTRAGFSFRDCSLPSSVRRRRSWRVIIIRSKGEYLGSVEAPDRERAEAVAIKQFAPDDDQRSRLLIRGRP